MCCKTYVANITPVILELQSCRRIYFRRCAASEMWLEWFVSGNKDRTALGLREVDPIWDAPQ
jgi:hypothetical protein